MVEIPALSVACLNIAGLVMFPVWTLRPCWKQQTELTNPLFDDSIQIACHNTVPRMGSGRVDLKPGHMMDLEKDDVSAFKLHPRNVKHDELNTTPNIRLI